MTALALLGLLAAVGWSLVPPGGGATAAQEVPELRITSTRYIVIDAETGEVFAQRRADEPAAMASLTKIFTAVEAIELAPPEMVITTTEDDLVSSEASQMGFGPEENFTLQDLLYGMMLPSGNDAARAIARALGGQPGDSGEQAIDRFVGRMNNRLRDMGLTNTTLVNPDGWGVPGHQSTVHDLAAFTMYALRYPRFVDAIGTERYETSDGAYAFSNNNRLLGVYDGLVGGKTGYDNDAGWCLVEVAERDGSTMISVTLDGVAPDDWYDDNRVLLDYAFEQKAGRTAAGLGVVGQVIGYRDPDAAVIARGVQPGASIGIGAPPPEATVTGGLGQVAPASGGSGEPPRLGSPIGGGRGTGPGFAAVAAVVAALVAIRFVSVFGQSPLAAGPAARPHRRERHLDRADGAGAAEERVPSVSGPVDAGGSETVPAQTGAEQGPGATGPGAGPGPEVARVIAD